ncbi:hypothetical protein ACN27B_08570 [Micromonospora sp. WMMD754]|uniref:hypothetical protein n=1 Tax=Micromonospora sp. WMMD754 TaxID=3404114 RepID=UPI003BF520B0
MTRLAIAACGHVLCHPQTPTPRTQPISLPPSTGWRDRLDDADIRAARAARLAAQARGFGLERDPIIPAHCIPNECGCPNPPDGMVPDCYWTGQHLKDPK